MKHKTSVWETPNGCPSLSGIIPAQPDENSKAKIGLEICAEIWYHTV